MKINFPMRSLMFVPAHNEHLMNSAIRSNADVLLLDIEDSVQPSENKKTARNNVLRYIADGKFSGRILFPRINDRESGELLKDVYQLTVKGITGFMYPKAKSGKDIYFIGKLLETIEFEKGFPIGTFKLIPLIETTGAVMNIQDICNACPTRVVAVAFGCEDFVTDLGGKHDAEGVSIFTARSMIAMGAKTCGVIPIDTVHIKVHDLEDLEQNLKLSKKLGFEGMLVLNPKELPLVHQYYSPSYEEIGWAKEMVELAAEAVREGKGVAVKDNKFIGPPMLKMAEDILRKYKMMSVGRNISIITKDNCCGCTACYACCPVNAIKMVADNEGFLYPKVDDEKCILCGKCVNVCQNVKFYIEPQYIYASCSEDTLRSRSSSGGIFSMLAESILNKGGGICAVGYSEDCKECLHKIVYASSELDDLRRAKFVQSKKYDIFKRVEKQLKQGREMLFCGTPCEVGGLRQYLNREYDNLLTCDLICGCVSSPDVYRRYVEFLNEKYQSEVTSVNFKDKRQGWRGKAIAVTFKNGEEYYNSILDDDYCVSFHSRYNIRPSCFNCKYRNLKRVADITLGDFWAIEKYNEAYDDNKGTSFVLVNTPKGKRYFDDLEGIDRHLMDIDLEEYCTKYNWCMHRNPTDMPGQERATFYSDVHTMRFDEMAAKDLATIKEIRKQKKLNSK